ncbi:MAG TPA: type I polyketide synthase, partial [Streptosporangiaceae bacterium]
MERESTGLEIAIVGMAGRFPGAGSVGAYWDTIVEGRDSIIRSAGEHPRARRADHVPAWGVLAGVDRFDAGYFGYTPRDAALIDPQQRALLEVAVHTLEHAGYAGAGERVGVYAGTSISTYLLQNLIGNPAVNASYAELILANDKDSLATRISYHLDLRGPSITVQTACSTSLVAVHLACQALLARDCDLALAGGVSIQLPQDGYLAEPGGILSPDGHCRPFDAAANGVVPGCGVAMVALKCLDDALRDGDTIHAVILGSAVTNDGATKVGYTAPSIDSQAETVLAAQRLAGVDAGAIGYVEAHGTGTPIGDPIEVAALTRAFRATTARREFCALGSVKSLIGHLDAAAGVAGLIKAVLALRHGMRPPSPYFQHPNPVLDLPRSPFYLPVVAEKWPDGPRFAAVNSVGMGGTNAHVVLQQAPAEATVAPASRTWQVLPLSAMTPAALAASREGMADHLAAHESVALADVAHTLQVGRRVLPHRVAMVCADTGSAAELLAHGKEGVWQARQESRDTPVAFLFPGQGSQRPGMAREVYREEPVFRQCLDRIGRLLTGHGIDLLDLL